MTQYVTKRFSNQYKATVSYGAQSIPTHPHPVHKAVPRQQQTCICIGRAIHDKFAEHPQTPTLLPLAFPLSVPNRSVPIS